MKYGTETQTKNFLFGTTLSVVKGFEIFRKGNKDFNKEVKSFQDFKDIVEGFLCCYAKASDGQVIDARGYNVAMMFKMPEDHVLSSWYHKQCKIHNESV